MANVNLQQNLDVDVGDGERGGVLDVFVPLKGSD